MRHLVLCEFWCMWTNVVLCEEGNKKGGALGKGEAETVYACKNVYVETEKRYRSIGRQKE